jgi:hypothetical protein
LDAPYFGRIASSFQKPYLRLASLGLEFSEVLASSELFFSKKSFDELTPDRFTSSFWEPSLGSSSLRFEISVSCEARTNGGFALFLWSGDVLD